MLVEKIVCMFVYLCKDVGCIDKIFSEAAYSTGWLGGLVVRTSDL